MFEADGTYYRLVGPDGNQILKTEDYDLVHNVFDTYRKKFPDETFTVFIDWVTVKSEMWLHYSRSEKTGESREHKTRYSKFFRHVRFQHQMWKDIENTSGITFKVVIDHQDQKIIFSWALCKNDKFDRRIGRETAEERFSMVKIGIDKKNRGDIKNQILGHIMNSKSKETSMLREYIESKINDGWEVA